MPVIRVNIRDLESLLGRPLSRDEITRYLAVLKCEVEGFSEETLEYEANHDRPDIFSVEGLARAIRGILGDTSLRYTVLPSDVKAFSDHVPGRPYVALAVVRDLELGEEAVAQIMQLQEKLASTYGRNRRKASIGVYDLDKIKPPIKYTLADPYSTKYIPLNEREEMTLSEVLEKTEKGKMYGHIIKHMDKYPVLVDSSNTILSLAPILNADYNKVTTRTKNILIDSTGTDPELVVDMVTIMALNIAERSRSGIVEEIQVVYPDHTVITAPRRTRREITVDLREVNKLLGVELSVGDALEALKRCYYEISQQDGLIVVKPPVFRVDVKSWVDVAEDIATIFGYDKIGMEADSLPATKSVGRIHPLEYLSSKIRDTFVELGFTEVANYMMSNEYLQVGLFGQDKRVFKVQNPRSEKYTCLRAWLTPGLLEIIQANAEKKSRIYVFEIGDVTYPSEHGEVVEERRAGFAISHPNATLTDGLAYARAVLNEVSLKPSFKKARISGFLEERTASIVIKEVEVGFVGEVHPKVLIELGLQNPVVIGEIYLNRVLELIEPNP